MNNGMRYAVIATSVLVIAAMVMVWLTVDLNAAGQVASIVAACAAVIALARELLRRGGQSAVAVALRTGRASARSGADANSGITGPANSLHGEFRAERTGDADGDGGNANTGIRLS
ncbi:MULTISPECIES: hypothetical protein [Streptomyces]|jgi:Flp pilus assembly protein TadB|uniref:Uncharacterized protein n=1 Tax=Streptomyces pilosus TaxID=28893 RepID=A0A918BG98_9ACTN|nr:hypothetical protein [Streptomyces pilosus]GGQ67166.1 hypothetical protein GCM10010280_11520 [Streptomyces pilosus]